MTSDETITAVTDGNPMTAIEGTAPLDALPDEWDDGTLALLKDDGPATTGELVLVPGYSQSEWDRQQVRQLQASMAAETYLWDNAHKTDQVLVRDLLLLLGRGRAAAAHMAGAEAKDGAYVHHGNGLPPVNVVLEGAIYYAEMTPAPKPLPAPKPKRRRPSQARKAAGGGAA